MRFAKPISELDEQAKYLDERAAKVTTRVPMFQCVADLVEYGEESVRMVGRRVPAPGRRTKQL